MRRRSLLRMHFALADDNTRYQGRKSCGHVYDDATGEVEDPQVAEEGALTSPDHVGDGKINHRHPQSGKPQCGRKLHAFGEGADHQGRGDDGEGKLKCDENRLRNRARQGIGGHAAEECLAQSAKKCVQSAFPCDHAGRIKNNAVTEDDPEHSDQGGDPETLHEHG